MGDFDEFADLENELLQDYEFPLLVGRKSARKDPHWLDPVLIGLAYILLTGGLILLLLPFIPISKFFRQRKRFDEFKNDILNPEFLRGTGLVIFQNRNAKLIAKPNIPPYEFDSEDITKIVLQTEYYGFGRTTRTLQIHLHGFHALDLYGFDLRDSKDMVKKLVSIYDIDCEIVDLDKSDSGGGGGGG
jgi:hypothetical protein|tara:strand:- start:132 stop:695 length:564 start_codon:yes stop_codon:yes gene_type:complete